MGRARAITISRAGQRPTDASPFAIARGGLLFLVNGAAFQADVQALHGRVLSGATCAVGKAEALNIAIAFSSVHGRRADGLLHERCSRGSPTASMRCVELPRL